MFDFIGNNSSFIKRNFNKIQCTNIQRGNYIIIHMLNISGHTITNRLVCGLGVYGVERANVYIELLSHEGIWPSRHIVQC